MLGSVVKLKGTNGLVPVRMYQMGSKYHAIFPYDQQLKDDIKAMQGSRWDPDKKAWKFKKCPGNDFRLAYLLGLDPYSIYDKELEPVENIERPLYDHQIVMLQHLLTRKQCILAAEMRTGKTLVAIEALERIPIRALPIWVGPRITLPEIRNQFREWDAKIVPEFMTYAKMKNNERVPNVIIFDESTKLKNSQSGTTKAAQELTDKMREKHGDECYVFLLSGRPSPNSPEDWFGQCEVARPGFLREGNPIAFKQRLAIEEEGIGRDGVTYKKIVTWKDNPSKCDKCGKFKEEHGPSHSWIPSKNEVEALEKRLRGLVLPVFYKDCIGLPETRNREIYIPASPRTKMLERLIRQEAANPGELMFQLRALSDGFRVLEEKTGEFVSCGSCNGTGLIQDIEESVPCPDCVDGQREKTRQSFEEVATAKKDVVIGLLDEFREYNRIIFYAPYYGSIDLLIRWIRAHGWDVMQFDGRVTKFHSDTLNVRDPSEMLELFQSDVSLPIAFVGNQESAGEGLTLHESPAVVFYSNSFKSQYREQAKARILKNGKEAAEIIDIFHLPIDKYVVDLVNNKIELQDMTLGKVTERLDIIEQEWTEAGAVDRPGRQSSPS